MCSNDIYTLIRDDYIGGSEHQHNSSLAHFRFRGKDYNSYVKCLLVMAC